MIPFKALFSCALFLLVALCGCSSLPTAGPSKNDVIDQAQKDGQVRFQVIDIDRSVVDTILAQPTEGFHSRFGHYGLPPEPSLSVGDTVGVSIWEAGGGSLFGGAAALDRTGSGSRPVTIPDQIVPRDGAISVPFAGRVKVAGRTILEVQHDIEARLAGKAAEPQVIVTVPKSAANSVTVSGEVVNGARVPLSPEGDRILDIIAAAGGAKSPVYETFVRLSRQGVTATIPFETLIADPAENIYAWPADVLTLVKTPQSFDAMGAIGHVAEIPFDSQHLTLSRALAKAAGPLDDRADPAGVFLFRNEPAPLVAALTHAPESAGAPSTVPIVYRLDMSNAEAFFLAKQFPVDDKDIVFIANARLSQVQKFFALIGTITSPIISGAVVEQSVK
jgi:polysaccharide export outer membrane protein